MGVGSAFFSFMISNLQGSVNESEKSTQSKINRLEIIKEEYELPLLCNFFKNNIKVYKRIKRHIECMSMEQS